MAEAAVNQSAPSGYDEQFVNPPDEDLQCIICYLPSKEPVLTRCGHRFCKQCLEEYMRRQEQEGSPLTCPVDREALERNKDIFPDKASERKILSQFIKCPSESCKWTGELRAKEAHLENCEGLLTACPNNCGIKVANEKVQYHVENECPLTDVPCPLNWMGCTLKIRREVLESHLQCDTRHHLDLNCYMLRGNQDEVRKLETEVRELREEENDLHNVIEERVRACQDHFEERVNMLTDDNKKLRRDLSTARKALFFFFAVIIAIVAVLLGLSNQERAASSRLETKMKRSVEEQSKLEMKVMELDQAYKHLEDRIQLVQSMTVDLQEQCNSFKWKIGSFSEVLRKEKSEGGNTMDSSPFYTCGYKCQLELSLSLEKEDTLLSLMLFITEGEYDVTLTWPFNKTVKLTLFDQQENAKYMNNIVRTEHTHYRLGNHLRPVLKNDFIVVGFYNFTTHEKLQERSYIVDDTIFIQVQMITPKSWH